MTAALIFLLTLALVLWQPKIGRWRLGIGWSATLGAAAALGFGVMQWQDIPVVWGIVWNATFTFIALIVISLLLDEAGFFTYIAVQVARAAGGRGPRLFSFLVLLGAAVSALFANDGAALILTPIVLGILLALRFTPAATLAFVMAAGFIADTASLPLPVSNLVNIIVADYFHLSFAAYTSVMLPVTLVAVLASLGVLWGYYRAEIPRQYPVMALEPPQRMIRDRRVFRAGWAVLGWLLFGFFVLDAWGVPVSAVAGAGALVLLGLARRGKIIDTQAVLKQAPWSVVVFSLGMYLVVYGLSHAGLTEHLADGFRHLADYGVWGAALGTGVTMAVLSAGLNNLPAVLIGSLAIDGSGATGAVQSAMVYANIIGCDLGPKFTPIGSLATLLWLHVLARKHVVIGWGYYLRVGLVLTTPVLLLTLLALAARLTLGG
ncbi:arsenic transporter [Halothiobacillus sp. DCM-1]|uniref:arsenic transporter n=1 Tax=Halothiobacillus sp. DCM-1 TaxID=3112558 RepID=UPI0032479C87